MAVYYKFRSAKDYDSVAIDGHFISVGHLKEKIFELKHLGSGTDFDLVVANAQTDEEYLDEGMLIPKNTSVLIRRVPGRPRKATVTAVNKQEEPNVQSNNDDGQAVKGGVAGVSQSAADNADDYEWDEFGDDLYAIPETLHVQSTIPIQDAAPVSKDEVESKIKALIDTPALAWQCQPSDGFGPGRGFGRGMGGRMMAGHGFGRGGFEKKTPPQGYVCHRCKVPGHLIQHCPTNGDPAFDIKRVKPPTGIPKSMLMATLDGSYALPSGAVAALKPNEAAFEKEIEGMPSTRSVGDLPPELHCPLCKKVMKDAVLTSKCCFTSFCDRCIRDLFISKSICMCGATNVLADDLLPNKTLRDTINRILESNNSSTENGGSAFQVQDMESRIPQAKVPSPTQSVASKGQQISGPPPQRDETVKARDTSEENKSSNLPLIQERGKTVKVPDVLPATHDSRLVKEVVSRGSVPLAEEDIQQKPISGEAAAEMQWKNAQDFAPENHMMPLGTSAFPYRNPMHPGFDGFMPPYGGPIPLYMCYGLNPMEVAFPGSLPHGPFGGPGFMLPYGPPQPQRDLAELAMGFHSGTPAMNREEFEACSADLKRKREMERHNDRQCSKEGEYGRAGSSTGYATSRSKSKLAPVPPPSEPHHHSRHSPERRPELSHSSSKKKRETRPSPPGPGHHRHHRCHSSHQLWSKSPSEVPPASVSSQKHKPSVLSCISFPENGRGKPPASPTGATTGSLPPPRSSNGNHRHEAADDDSSDDERHFKRRRPSSRHQSPPLEEGEHRRHSKCGTWDHHSRQRSEGGGIAIACWCVY